MPAKPILVVLSQIVHPAFYIVGEVYIFKARRFNDCSPPSTGVAYKFGPLPEAVATPISSATFTSGSFLELLVTELRRCGRAYSSCRTTASAFVSLESVAFEEPNVFRGHRM